MAYLSPMINTETNSSTFYLLFEDSTSGPMYPRTDSGLTFQPTANLLGVGGITVTNTSTVVNLNADKVDGMDATNAATASTVVARDALGNVNSATSYYYSNAAYTKYNETTKSIDFIFN